MIRIAWYTAIILGTVTILAIIWQFHIALGIFIFSLAVAMAFRPLVDFFTQFGIPRNVSSLLSYIGVMSLLVGFVMVVNQPLFSELQRVTDDFLMTYERMQSQWSQGETQFNRFLAEQLPPAQTIYEALTEGQLEGFTRAVFGMALNTLEIGGKIAITLVLSMYWNVDRIRFERLWLSLLPVHRRAQARTIWRAIKDQTGSYIRSEFLQSLCAGILLGIGYWAIGLPYPILLAFQVSLMRLIPWLGAIIAGIVPFLVGLSVGPIQAIFVVFLTGFIQLLLKTLLRPFLFDHNRYSSVLLVLVTIALAHSFGLIGAMMGPLLAITMQILFRYVYQFSLPLSTGSTQITHTGVAKQLESIQETAANMDPPISPEVRNLLDRLSQLVLNAGDYLQEQTFSE
jgi:predicted PurR-regulated permease PerM